MITETIRQYVLDACGNSNNGFGAAFFSEHLLVVCKYGTALARTLAADSEIVELAAYLHDIAAIQDIASIPNHHIFGAEIARGVLARSHYPAEGINQVEACILSHSSPVQVGCGSLEQICLSNADAMSQITNPGYWLYFAFGVRKYDFEIGRGWLLQRIERNWSELIAPAKALIENEYLLAQRLLGA